MRRGPEGYGTSPTPNATTSMQNKNQIHWPRPETTRIIGSDRTGGGREAGDAKVPRPADPPPDRKNPPHSISQQLRGISQGTNPDLIMKKWANRPANRPDRLPFLTLGKMKAPPGPVRSEQGWAKPADTRYQSSLRGLRLRLRFCSRGLEVADSTLPPSSDGETPQKQIDTVELKLTRLTLVVSASAAAASDMVVG